MASKPDYRLQPALFLDFDGTIRHSNNGKFINKIEDIMLFPDVENKVWQYRDNGYLILGITNQGGVAFGYKKPDAMQKELQATLDLFEKNPFHDVKSSYHHEKGRVEPYNHRSLLRKPDIGMLVQCETECFNQGIIIDWENSIFVGDRPEDEECARRANIQFIGADEFFNRKKDN